MIPKIASALARILEPIKPVERPGQSVTLSKYPDSSEGGYSPPGHQSGSEEPSDSQKEERDDSLEPNLVEGKKAELSPSLPLQPGLTQVILDLAAHRAEKSAGSAVQSYETGAKEQKKNARLPKGSMLDKKVG